MCTRPRPTRSADSRDSRTRPPSAELARILSWTTMQGFRRRLALFGRSLYARSSARRPSSRHAARWQRLLGRRYRGALPPLAAGRRPLRRRSLSEPAGACFSATLAVGARSRFEEPRVSLLLQQVPDFRLVEVRRHRNRKAQQQPRISSARRPATASPRKCSPENPAVRAPHSTDKTTSPPAQTAASGDR